jgi:hypothetical protein
MRVWSRTASMSERQAEVAGAAQEAFAGTDDEGQGFGGEGVVAQAGAVELVEDELLRRFREPGAAAGRVGDAGADFLVDGQGEGLEQRRLADEDQVVGAGEVLAEQAQFAQAIGGHEVGVVNDGDEHFAGAVDAEGFLDQQAFAAMVVALKLDLEGLAEDAQGVVIGVQGAVDNRGDHAFGVVVQEGLFEHAFAGAGFAQDQAEAALLGVDSEDVEDFLLVGQQREGFGSKGLRWRPKWERIINFGVWI